MTTATSEEILHAFAAEIAHDQQTVDRYIARYPELAEDFIDLLVDLRLSAETPPAIVERESLERLDAAFARFMSGETSSAVEQLFEPFKGQSFVALARTLNVPRALLTALRDRLVIHTSVPARFTGRLSSAMRETPERLKAYLSLPPVTDAAQQFKSDARPGVVGQVSFETLLNDTEMDDGQRSMLREDLLEDGRE